MLKAAREKKTVAYKGSARRLPAGSSAETWQARREWHDLAKGQKEENKTKQTNKTNTKTENSREHSIQQGYHSEWKER